MRKLNFFSKTIPNIQRQFILHEILTCNDKNPPQFNKKIKGIIQEKNNAFKAYRNNSGNTVLVCLNSSIKCTKEKFYNKIASELNDTTIVVLVKAKGKIIPNLDCNKAHGHDNISICMLKI